MSSKENLKDALIRSKKSNTELRKDLDLANNRVSRLEKANISLKITIAFLRENNRPNIVKWFNRWYFKIRGYE